MGADFSEPECVGLTPQLSAPGNPQGLYDLFLRFAGGLKGTFLSTGARRGQGRTGRALPSVAKGQRSCNRVPCAPHLPHEAAPRPCVQRGSGTPLQLPSTGDARSGRGTAGRGYPVTAAPQSSGLGIFRAPSLPRVPFLVPRKGWGRAAPWGVKTPTPTPSPARAPAPLPPAGFSSKRGSEPLEEAAATGPGARCLTAPPRPGPHL